jgi:hypothetical protein
MKTPKRYIGALALFCVTALFIGMVSAAGAPSPDCGNFGSKIAHGGPVKMLDRLEEQGYDISAIRTAFASGATDVARTLMHEFMEAHRDLLPARNATEKNGPGSGPGMMTDHLARLEAKGYDVSAIRAAVQSGDTVTARTLMHQFMEAHKDELPRPGHGRNSTPLMGVATI